MKFAASSAKLSERSGTMQELPQPLQNISATVPTMAANFPAYSNPLKDIGNTTMRTRRMIQWMAVCLLSLAFGRTVDAQELTEGSAATWGTFTADNAIASVSNDTSKVRVGTQSLKFVTQSGFDTGVRYPANPTADINLTGKNYLVFWMYAINNNIGFQGNQPIVVLKFMGGTVTLEPQTEMMTNRAWRYYHVPLAGDSQWTRTVTGTPDFAHLRQIEIHQDTWDYGFTIYYDGMEFVNLTPGGLPPAGPAPPAGVNPNAIAPKVLLYIYNPIMENHGGLRMHQVFGWQNPVDLTSQIVSDFRTHSHDLVRYNLVETQIVDAYPYLQDGFRYTDATFDAAISTGNYHTGTFDYVRFVADNNLTQRVDSGEIDEVWVYAFPGAGMWESAMAGTGAYWINGVPYPETGGERAFVIMGWNFERGVAEALHSYGHRAESTMVHSYGSWEPNRSNNWSRFALLDSQAPGLGGIGNIHFPVNGTSDYDYANPRFVTSNADDWYNYPNFTGITRTFNFHEWSPNGTDPQGDYMRWWYDHLPHMASKAPDQFLANWWRYLTDVDQFKAWNGNLYVTVGIPSVTTISPQNGDAVSGMVAVRANAFVDGALGRVDLYVDGVYHSSDTLSPYTFAWNTAGLSGNHTLQTRAYELQNGTEGVSQTLMVTISQPTSTVSGVLTLQSVLANGAAQPITFVFRPADNSGDATRTVSVLPNGIYSVAGIPRKSGTLHVKGSRYLAKNVGINATSGDVSGINAALKTGDSNNDNAVDVADLLQIINHYNKTQGSNGYLDACDFNLDGADDVTDLLLVIGNYNQRGDN